MNGLEYLRSPERETEEIAALLSRVCPPGAVAQCEGRPDLNCRDCWTAWLLAADIEPVRATDWSRPTLMWVRPAGVSPSRYSGQ